MSSETVRGGRTGGVGRGAGGAPGGRADGVRRRAYGLPPAVVQTFYDRMRVVAPAAVGAIERDRADDPARPFPATACGRLAGSLDDAGLRALGMWAHHWCLRFYDDDIAAGLRLVREIAGRAALGWTADELRWLLGESYATDPVVRHRFLLPLAAARELGCVPLAR